MAHATAAPGTKHGPAPLPTAMHAPDFVRLEHEQLQALLNKLRSPLAVHTYLLLRCHMNFTSGEFLGGYARLMDLMTPPVPERGRRREGPTYKQVRTAVDDLILVGLVNRGLTNKEQGQLRLFLAPAGSAKTPPKAIPLQIVKKPVERPTPTPKRTVNVFHDASKFFADLNN